MKIQIWEPEEKSTSFCLELREDPKHLHGNLEAPDFFQFPCGSLSTWLQIMLSWEAANVCFPIESCRVTRPSSWETLGLTGDKRGAVRAVGLTPVLTARALLTQIHLANQSALGQRPGMASAGPPASASSRQTSLPSSSR